MVQGALLLFWVSLIMLACYHLSLQTHLFTFSGAKSGDSCGLLPASSSLCALHMQWLSWLVSEWLRFLSCLPVACACSCGLLAHFPVCSCYKWDWTCKFLSLGCIALEGWPPPFFPSRWLCLSLHVFSILQVKPPMCFLSNFYFWDRVLLCICSSGWPWAFVIW